MSKTLKKNFDLFTLCCKRQLIGSEIQLKDGSFRTVSDWYADFKTNEIHLNFEKDSDGKNVDGLSFDLSSKFFVKIDSKYKSVKPKKKKKKHKIK